MALDLATCSYLVVPPLIAIMDNGITVLTLLGKSQKQTASKDHESDRMNPSSHHADYCIHS